VGLIFGDRSERKAAIVCLLLFAVFLVESSVYLFAPIHWPATLPLYGEVLMGPIYVFGAIVGYSSFIAAVWRKLFAFIAAVWRKLFAEPPSNATGAPSLSSGGTAQRPALFKSVIRAVPVLSGIAFVPVLGAWYVNDEVYAHKYTPNLINTLTEPWPAADELVAYLGENIGLRNTRQFRGMASLNSINYESMLLLASLWENFVPFLNVYSTFLMPGLYYFMGHMPLPEPEGAVPGSSSEIPVGREWWTLGNLDASSKKILQALGVRYVFQSPAEGDETRPPDDAVLRLQLGPTTVAGRQIIQKVYEYSDSNVGNYSPTKVVIARDAPSILQYLWRTSFDPRQSIILPERVGEPLVEATAGKILFERGAIRVQAESRGHSLLLLPVQYSRCLVSSDPVTARLLPANLVQTAVLFQGSIDFRIYLEYGLFRPGCRKQDLADLAELGIVDDKSAGLPLAQLHPYAISSLADLPHAVGAVIKKLTSSP
jgi:hypothetical protein